jgi:RNA polymerase sigma factor (sigma-70 family)
MSTPKRKTTTKKAKTTTKSRTGRASAPAVDWAAREAEVTDLAGLAAVADKVDRPNPPRTQVVRWQNLSTPELVALARAGHLDAFDPLYRRYAPAVLTYIRHRIGWDRPEAEDIASEVWASALASIGTQEWSGLTERAFVGWLCGIARQRVRLLYAAWAAESAVEPVRGEWSLTGNPLYAPAGDDTTCPQKEQLRSRLHAAVKTLSDGQRDVMKLRLAGLGSQDIAAKTGLTMQQVRSATRNALTSLVLRTGEPIEELYRADPNRIRTAVQAMPGDLRDVMSLRLVGLRQAEIEDHLNLSRSTVGSRWRAAERTLRRILAEAQKHGLDDDETTAERKAAAREQTVARLREAAQRLSDKQHRLVLLRLDGKTYHEMADITGTTKAGAESLLRHARNTLTLRLGPSVASLLAA